MLTDRARALTVAVALLASASLPAGRGPVVDTATVAHVLNRAAFGPSARDGARLRELGVSRYLDEQLRPETIADTAMRARLAGLDTLELSSRTIAERYHAPLLELQRTARASLTPEARQRLREARQDSRRALQELAAQKLLRAIYSERQLHEVLVDFWFNHFNVFAGKGPVQAYLTEYERDAIRPHVLGRFRDLLGAVAHSPAMLFYLDNWQSADPALGERVRARPATVAAKPRTPRGLNENYARELLELHTLGVDGGYSQADVVEVAKAFTGWTIRGPRQGGAFWFDERRHARGPKRVLGSTIDRGGEQDGEAVLDLLARHPATARFIALKLARRLVADDPPPALVERAADVFRRTDGDLRAVTRSLIEAPEFIAAPARGAKVKTPFEFVASALRVADAEVTDATALLPRLQELGMPLYLAQPPTGYADRADAWVNTGALLGRMNFALALVDGRLAGVRVDLAAWTERGGPAEMRAWLIDTWLAGAASAATRQTLDKTQEPAQLAALTLGSPEFQRR